ncbi:MAG: ATP-binding cassette domain-containing protein [Chitinophagales bacterium]|nr:ATP-binding cassette domain-containing protein [Chitinophagales bacterium]MDW8274162.1 ATP-binding cassette domain-containing protein [Chitinophagales bacterium]
MTKEPVVQYENVAVKQGDNLVLSDVSFSVAPGEFIYLIGRTGSGKSSLLKTLYAELPVASGSAQVCGFNLRSLQNRQIPFLRRKLGIVFQDFHLLYNLNVFENLEFVLKATGWKSASTIKERIEEILSEFGLAEKIYQYPVHLSGGEQQRLVIARALLNNPPLILADEPTGNLDPETSDEIMRLLLRINRTHNTAIFMATHNYLLIDRYPAKILRCESGMLIHEKGIIMD